MAKYLGASVEQLVSNIDLASVIQSHTLFKDTCALKHNLPCLLLFTKNYFITVKFQLAATFLHLREITIKINVDNLNISIA